MENLENCPPAFNGGLLPAIVQEQATKEILMLAWMNEEAFNMTLETGIAHYFSRSRKKIWLKGETSGHFQKVKGLRLDCDRDAILLIVEQVGGAACHTGRASCFYRELQGGEWLACSPLLFDPDQVYGNKN